MRPWITGPSLLAAFLLSGCHSVGPTLIKRDHFDYNAAISNSWKEQMLQNMIRLRYGEAPVFLDVASVIAQYSFETQVGATSPGWDRPNQVGPPIGSGGARWIDRPTITFQPRTGPALAQTILRPISLSAIFALVQAGWPLDLTLSITLRSVNGVSASTRRGAVEWNPEFLRAIQALTTLSESGGGGAHSNVDTVVYRLTPEPLSPATRDAQKALREVLNLSAEVDEYEIVLSPQRLSDRQISLATASTLDVLNVLASRFDVPEAHVAKGWTFATPNPGPRRTETEVLSPIRVHAGEEPPEHVFVATQNRGAWFWIDDADYSSKRAFSFLTMLLTLSESHAGASPAVTIGAGG